MRLNEVLEMLWNSDPKDWHAIDPNTRPSFHAVVEGQIGLGKDPSSDYMSASMHDQRFVYANNVLLAIEMGIDLQVAQDRFVDFDLLSKSWNNAHTVSHVVDIFWNGELVYRTSVVVVDSANAILPQATFDSASGKWIKVSTEDYLIAALLDSLASLGRFNEYFEQSNLVRAE